MSLYTITVMLSSILSSCTFLAYMSELKNKGYKIKIPKKSRYEIVIKALPYYLLYVMHSLSPIINMIFSVIIVTHYPEIAHNVTINLKKENLLIKIDDKEETEKKIEETLKEETFYTKIFVNEVCRILLDKEKEPATQVSEIASLFPQFSLKEMNNPNLHQENLIPKLNKDQLIFLDYLLNMIKLTKNGQETDIAYITTELTLKMIEFIENGNDCFNPINKNEKTLKELYELKDMLQKMMENNQKTKNNFVKKFEKEKNIFI